MCSRHFLIFTVLLLIEAIAVAQSLKFIPKYTTIIDTSKGEVILNQCSRNVPKTINGFWRMEQKDLIILENNFKKVYKLKASDCCKYNLKIDDLNTFAFQFIGVSIKSKKYIYCNAFRIYNEADLSEDWKTEPKGVCDGGYNYWGVLFDTNYKIFKNLAINGE